MKTLHEPSFSDTIIQMGSNQIHQDITSTSFKGLWPTNFAN